MKLYAVTVDTTVYDPERRIKIEEHEVVKETEKMWAIQNGQTLYRYHKDDEDIIKRGSLGSDTRFKFYTLDERLVDNLIRTGIREGVYRINSKVAHHEKSKADLLELLTTLEGSE